ncbi:hypothetical protein [Gelidibacter pelagius]|uniref:Uncharacterized protein n=1 Tax=Gelidibacter pelagius TaxID=2819985 RepID=A0ABS3SUT6_9FLAO|nr:hypothetical protein [Gelidibacter pelagius]MBO3099449.1 hypothetical protein [Gelidibacter pelagius]
MAEKDHIKIINSLSFYKAINDRDQWFPRVTVEKVKTQEEVIYPDGGSWPIIQIKCINDDAILELDTVQTRKGTIKKRLVNYNINDKYLLAFKELFNLKTRYKETNALGINLNKNSEILACEASFKICEKCNAKYMAIYAKRSESARDDDHILYVHGIWKVELSKEFGEHLSI